jgi:hypothetical protein
MPMEIGLEETPGDLAAKLPRFEKVGAETLGLGRNRHFDLVVRSDLRIPVGMVSKTYRLIQHEELLSTAMAFVKTVPNASVAKIKVSMTAAGERMMMNIDLGEKYRIGPDGSNVGLQLLCRNSVDGSGAVRAHLGWFRFVCSNGMVVGVTLGRSRIVHKPDTDLNDVFAPLSEQLEVAKADRETMIKWVGTKVSLDRLRRWIDGEVAAKWNSLAACRIWHICSSGRDARFVPPFQKAAPSQRSVELLEPVLGAPTKAENLYAVAQALSWVASRRLDIDEAEASQREIGELLKSLRN